MLKGRVSNGAQVHIQLTFSLSVVKCIMLMSGNTTKAQEIIHKYWKKETGRRHEASMMRISHKKFHPSHYLAELQLHLVHI